VKSGVLPAPAALFAYITDQGSNDVAVIDLVSNKGTIGYSTRFRKRSAFSVPLSILGSAKRPLGIHRSSTTVKEEAMTYPHGTDERTVRTVDNRPSGRYC